MAAGAFGTHRARRAPAARVRPLPRRRRLARPPSIGPARRRGPRSSSSRDRRSPSVRRGLCFSMRRCASAYAAICGRCVTQSTWWSRASRHRLRPTGSADRPPMPASTSSKTSVGVASAPREHALDGQRDARQLAARRDPRQRPRRLARVGREQERRPRRRPSRRGRRGARSTANAASGKPSSTSASVTAGASRRRRPRARPCRAGGGRLRAAAPQPLAVRARVAPARASEAAQPVDLGAGVARRGRARPPRSRRTCAAGRRGRPAAPRSSAVARRPSAEPSVAPAQLERDVVDLGLEPGQPLGEARQARIEARQLGRVPRRRRASWSRAPAPRPTSALLRPRSRGVRAARRCPRPRVGARSSSTSPGARRGRLDLVGRVLRRARGGAASSAGSTASSRRAASLARHASTARRRRPAARRGRRTRRGGRAARRGRSRRCCSCWPWISTSGSTTAARRAAVTVSSSMRATLRPAAPTSRTQMSGSRHPGRTAPRPARRAAPWRTRPASARPPITRRSASMSSDLPAPVSPVMTVKPGPSATRARSMSARSRTVSSSSAHGQRCGSSSAFAAAGPRTAARHAAR